MFWLRQANKLYLFNDSDAGQVRQHNFKTTDDKLISFWETYALIKNIDNKSKALTDWHSTNDWFYLNIMWLRITSGCVKHILRFCSTDGHGECVWNEMRIPDKDSFSTPMPWIISFSICLKKILGKCFNNQILAQWNNGIVVLCYQRDDFINMQYNCKKPILSFV